MTAPATTATRQSRDEIAPSTIMQLGFGFWSSKALLTAVEVGVFTELATGPQDADALARRLGFAGRGTRDFLDALVALGLLRRDGGLYANSPESDRFLDRAKPTYIGAILEVANHEFYPHWGSLTGALRSGRPQHDVAGGGGFIEALSADPVRLRQFMRSMTALSQGATKAIAHLFPWERYTTFVDLGCAEGGLSVDVAEAHPHITGGGLDRGSVRSVFEDYVAAKGLTHRLRFYARDFFVDPLPEADVLAMGHILHGADPEQKRALLEKAYHALPDGGALIVFDAMIDDDRRENTFGLLMSLNMLLHTPGGFDYTSADCQGWLRDAGFRQTCARHLAGPDSMVVGIR